jgi:hypothetical protein
VFWLEIYILTITLTLPCVLPVDHLDSGWLVIIIPCVLPVDHLDGGLPLLYLGLDGEGEAVGQRPEI